MAFRGLPGAERPMVFVSEGCLSLTGYTAGELTSAELPWGRVTHPEDAAAVLAATEAHPGPYEVTYRIRSRTGEERWVCERGEAVRDPQGRVLGLEGFVSDVTELKRTERALRELTATLEQRVAERTAEAERRARQLRTMAKEVTLAEQRERRRVAQVLHDHLQQILAAAGMQLASLRTAVGTGEARRRLDHTADLLRECVDVSRSLAVELSPPVLNDGGLVAALEWLAERMHTQYGLTVDLSAPPEAEPAAEEVRVLLFHAVRELLFNVVKHAGVSRAALRLERVDDEAVVLTVADEGRGCPEDRLAAGTGFGLSELRGRLELLGGELSFDAKPGIGCHVSLRAPAGLLPESARRPQQAAPFVTDLPRPIVETGRARVLLADDHKIVREGLAAILAAHPDIEVVAQAADGESALEMTRSLRPDVVVMDLSMPRMNGIEATRLITAEMPEVRVIGLTMHDTRSMEARMRSAGAVACLNKDGAGDHLIRAIRGENR
jgi:PAS domain S-box-containing protein